jgi:hypothetical protein
VFTQAGYDLAVCLFNGEVYMENPTFKLEGITNPRKMPKTLKAFDIDFAPSEQKTKSK